MPISSEILSTLAAEKVRPDFVPASDYISPEFAQLEYERMWNKVWQVACREEEIPNVGDYVTYEIGTQSFIVVRTAPGTIKSYYNVCLHRGRRLTVGNGNAIRFHCNYHGWQWSLDGSIARVLDRDDWKGCNQFDDAALKLPETKIDTWQGFVFINMDPNAEPLAKYLDPVPKFLDPHEYGRMRFRFKATFRVPCNWKVAQEAFDEGYHIPATHPQLMPVQGDNDTRSFAHGKHGMFDYDPNRERPLGTPAKMTGKPMPTDFRPTMIEFFDLLNAQLPVLFTVRDGQAAHRLMSEVPADAPYLEVLMKTMQFQKEAAVADGSGWPNISMEQLAAAGTDWHIFPNIVTLPYPDGCIVYRSRPDGNDPDSCIYEVWGLARYAPGAEPAVTNHLFLEKDQWRGVGAVSPILMQDFDNMEQVQLGMKSYGFPGNRTTPKQEVAVSNMHRALREYIFGKG
jgi:phenylpropionate dioxygenase-like ring-hydroxylating dioxygenase large terminal subunit